MPNRKMPAHMGGKKLTGGGNELLGMCSDAATYFKSGCRNSDGEEIINSFGGGGKVATEGRGVDAIHLTPISEQIGVGGSQREGRKGPSSGSGENSERGEGVDRGLQID